MATDIYIYIYIRRPLFRGCHQAAKQRLFLQINSYLSYYILSSSYPQFFLDVLLSSWQSILSYIVGPKINKSPPALAITSIPDASQIDALA